MDNLLNNSSFVKTSEDNNSLMNPPQRDMSPAALPSNRAPAPVLSAPETPSINSTPAPVDETEKDLDNILSGNDEYNPVEADIDDILNNGDIRKTIKQTNEIDTTKWASAEATAKAVGISDVKNVYDNLPEYEKQWKQKERTRAINLNPALINAAQTDPDILKTVDAASAAELKKMNDTFEVFGEYNKPSAPEAFLKKAWYAMTSADRRNQTYKKIYDLMGTAGGKEKIRNLSSALNEKPTIDASGWSPADLVYATMDQLPYMKDTTLPILAGTGIGALAGAQTGPGAIVTGAIGAASGYTYAMQQSFQIETGSMYSELLDIVDEDDKPLDEYAMLGASVVYGSVSAGIELVPVGKFLNTIPGFKSISSIAAKKSIKEALKNQTKRGLLTEIGKDYAKAVGYEAAQEGTQQLISSQTKRYLKADANAKGANFKQNTLAEDFAEVADASLQAAKASILIPAAGSSIRAASGVKQINKIRETNDLARGRETKATFDASVYDSVQKSAEKLNLPEDKARLFHQKASQGTIYEDIFISRKDAENLLNDEKIKNSERLKVSGFLNKIASQLERPAGDLIDNIRLSYSDFATDVMPDKGLYETFKPYIKSYEEGTTISDVAAKKGRIKNYIAEGKKIAAERKVDFDRAYDAFLHSASIGQMPPLQKKELAQMNAHIALVMARETRSSIEQVLYEAGISYAREYRGTITAKSDMTKIIAAAREQAKANENQNLLDASKEIAKRDINEIKKALSAQIENPTDGDASAYIRLVNAISDLKLNLTSMTDEEIIDALGKSKEAIPDFKLDIKRSADDIAKSGMFSKTEKALGEIQNTDSDYIAIGGGRIPVLYEIFEENDIITSDKENYPAAYQPRDRSRVSSDAQINEIVSSFTPERVGKNIIANEGAPIVTKEGGNVIVGNGRTMAISRLYATNAGDKYKDYLKSEGFNIDGFKNPVLVRRINADLNEADLLALVDAANTSATMSYSTSETAMRDAGNMTGNLLDVLDPEAEINSSANRQFVKGFFNEVIPSSERNSYLDKDNQVTARGIERIENALVAMILPNTRFLSNLLENPDNNIRKATSFLAKAAPAITYLENEIAAGRTNANYSILPAVAAAAHILKRAKDKNMPVPVYLMQADMLEDPVDLTTRNILHLFDNISSTPEFVAKINDYVKTAMSEGNLKQDNLFGTPPRTKDEILSDITGLKPATLAATKPVEPAPVPAPAEVIKPEEVFNEPPKQADTAIEDKIQDKYTAEAPPAQNINDVGDSLLGNFKGAAKAYTWEELSDMNDLLREKYVTKRYIYPRPDFEQLNKEGLNERGAGLVLFIYDKINSKPAKGRNKLEEQKIYFDGLHRVMDITKAFAKEKGEWLSRLTKDMSLNDELFYRIFPNIENKSGSIFINYPAYNKEGYILGGNKFANAIYIDRYSLADIDKIINREKTPNGKAAKREAEPWEKFFTIMQDISKKYVVLFKASNERISNERYETEADAIDFVKKLYEKIPSEILKSKGFEIKFENMRTGMPRRQDNQDVKPEALMEVFGFRGVNFGEWTKQSERQGFINYAYDSFYDLSKLLNLPPKAMSLNGKLGIAFGAQGRSDAAAHFLPEYNEINLTRKSGAGSLAHEWWHALDFYFGDKIKDKDFSGVAALSIPRTGGTIRPEVFNAFAELKDRLKKRPVTEQEVAEKKKQYFERMNQNIKYFADSLKSDFAREGNGVAEFIDNLVNNADKYKPEDFPSIGLKFKNLLEKRRQTLDNMIKLQNLTQRIEQLNKVDEYAKSWAENTEFYNNAEHAGRITKGAAYWTKDTELGARAFASYIVDKITRENMQNRFLVGDEKFAVVIDYEKLFTVAAQRGPETIIDINEFKIPTYVSNPNERSRINAAFDKLFATLKTRETPQGVELYQSALSPDIRNKQVNVVDLTDNFKGIPSKEDLLAKINALIAKGEAIPTKSLGKLIDFKNDEGRDIAGHIVNSSKQGLTGTEDARHKITLNSIKDLIKESVFVEKEKNKKKWKKNIDEYYRFYVPVLLGKGKVKKIYTVRLVAEKYKGESGVKPDVAHLYDVIIEDKTPVPPRSKNTSLMDGENKGSMTIKVSDMLAGVKGFDGLNYRQEDKTLGSRGSYNTGSHLITLFETANKTTLIHEHGHHWINMFQIFAAKETASDRLKRDWKIMAYWLGVGDDGVITDEMHEKAAKAFETYFMTAEAPTFALRHIFTAFKRWLLNEYKTADVLGVDIPVEVREVFDRLLASDKDIKEFYSAKGLNAMFNSAEEAGMTDAEFAKYEDMFKQSVIEGSDARSKMLAALAFREKQDEFIKAKDDLRVDVLNEWSENKFFRALTTILTGKIGDIPIEITISEDELSTLFNGKDLSVLPKKASGKRLYDKDGLSVAAAADMLGLTPSELTQIIFNSRQTMRLFEEDLNRRVHDELGDGVSLDDVETDTLSLINTVNRKDFLLKELSNLLTRSGSKATLVDKTLKVFAENTIMQKEIRDINSDEYFRIFQTEGELASALLIEGKLKDAARHKERQVRNYYLYICAKETLADINAKVVRLRQIGKKEVNPSVDQIHQDAARVLLGKVGLSAKLGQKAKERMGNIALWVSEMRSNGYDVAIPDSYLMDMEQKPYTFLTAEDFLSLNDAVTNIIWNGREIKTFEMDGKRKTRDELIGQLRDTLLARFKLIKTTPSSNKPFSMTAAKGFRSVDAALTTLGGLANRIDKSDTRGIFHKLFVKPLTNAQNLENKLNKKYTDKLHDLIKGLSKETKARMGKYDINIAGMFNDKITTLEDIISIGLNMGNDFNLQRLEDGNGFTSEQLEFVADYLTKEHWDFIQSVWDLLENMYPMLEDHHKKLSGLDMEKVFPVPVDTKYGTYSGGYYPIVYDYEASSTMAAKKENRNETALLDNDYGRPTTSKGYTKARFDNLSEPLKIGLSVLGNHMNAVIHDVAYRKVLRQLWSMSNGADFIELFDRYVGKEYRQMLNGLLRSVANLPNQEARDVEGVEKVLRFVRRRATLAGLGFRISTILAQPLGFFQSIAKMTEGKQKMGGKHGGTYWTAIGIKKLINSDTRKWAFDVSGELQARLSNNDASVMLRIRELQGNNAFKKFAAFRTSAEAWSYKAMGYMDYFVAMATWLGAYEQAVADLKFDPADALFYADRTMLSSQGSGNLKDTIALQRKGEAFKMFTLFYSFFSAMYQMSGQLVRDAKSAKTMSEFMDMTARFFALYIVSSCMGKILAGDFPDKDDDESLLAWIFDTTLGYLLSAIPFVRDISGLKYGSTGKTPYGRQADSAYYWAKEIERALDGDVRFREAVKRTLDVGGIATGLPIGGQFADTTSYFAGLLAGEYKADNLSDILWGIYKGKGRKD